MTNKSILHHTMQLIPEDSAIQQRLPMFHVAKQLTAGNDHYSLKEKAFAHLIIRADFENPENKTIQQAIENITGLQLPETLQSTENKDFILNWISPDELLLLAPEKTEFNVEKQLRETMQGHFAKSQALIRRTGKDTFQLIVRRSFSDHIWKWIVDAGSRE